MEKTLKGRPLVDSAYRLASELFRQIRIVESQKLTPVALRSLAFFKEGSRETKKGIAQSKKTLRELRDNLSTELAKLESLRDQFSDFFPAIQSLLSEYYAETRDFSLGSSRFPNAWQYLDLLSRRTIDFGRQLLLCFETTSAFENGPLDKDFRTMIDGIEREATFFPKHEDEAELFDRLRFERSVLIQKSDAMESRTEQARTYSGRPRSSGKDALNKRYLSLLSNYDEWKEKERARLNQPAKRLSPADWLQTRSTWPQSAKSFFKQLTDSKRVRVDSFDPEPIILDNAIRYARKLKRERS